MDSDLSDEFGDFATAVTVSSSSAPTSIARTTDNGGERTPTVPLNGTLAAEAQPASENGLRKPSSTVSGTNYTEKETLSPPVHSVPALNQWRIPFGSPLPLSEGSEGTPRRPNSMSGSSSTLKDEKEATLERLERKLRNSKKRVSFSDRKPEVCSYERDLPDNFFYSPPPSDDDEPASAAAATPAKSAPEAAATAAACEREEKTAMSPDAEGTQTASPSESLKDERTTDEAGDAVGSSRPSDKVYTIRRINHAGLSSTAPSASSTVVPAPAAATGADATGFASFLAPPPSATGGGTRGPVPERAMSGGTASSAQTPALLSAFLPPPPTAPAAPHSEHKTGGPAISRHAPKDSSAPDATTAASQSTTSSRPVQSAAIDKAASAAVVTPSVAAEVSVAGTADPTLSAAQEAARKPSDSATTGTAGEEDTGSVLTITTVPDALGGLLRGESYTSVTNSALHALSTKDRVDRANKRHNTTDSSASPLTKESEQADLLRWQDETTSGVGSAEKSSAAPANDRRGRRSGSKPFPCSDSPREDGRKLRHEWEQEVRLRLGYLQEQCGSDPVGMLTRIRREYLQQLSVVEEGFDGDENAVDGATSLALSTGPLFGVRGLGSSPTASLRLTEASRATLASSEHKSSFGNFFFTLLDSEANLPDVTEADNESSEDADDDLFSGIINLAPDMPAGAAGEVARNAEIPSAAPESSKYVELKKIFDLFNDGTTLVEEEEEEVTPKISTTHMDADEAGSDHATSDSLVDKNRSVSKSRRAPPRLSVVSLKTAESDASALLLSRTKSLLASSDASSDDLHAVSAASAQGEESLPRDEVGGRHSGEARRQGARLAQHFDPNDQGGEQQERPPFVDFSGSHPLHRSSVAHTAAPSSDQGQQGRSESAPATHSSPSRSVSSLDQDDVAGAATDVLAATDTDVRNAPPTNAQRTSDDLLEGSGGFEARLPTFLSSSLRGRGCSSSRDVVDGTTPHSNHAMLDENTEKSVLDNTGGPANNDNDSATGPNYSRTQRSSFPGNLSIDSRGKLPGRTGDTCVVDVLRALGFAPFVTDGQWSWLGNLFVKASEGDGDDSGNAISDPAAAHADGRHDAARTRKKAHRAPGLLLSPTAAVTNADATFAVDRSEVRLPPALILGDNGSAPLQRSLNNPSVAARTNSMSNAEGPTTDDAGALNHTFTPSRMQRRARLGLSMSYASGVASGELPFATERSPLGVSSSPQDTSISLPFSPNQPPIDHPADLPSSPWVPLTRDRPARESPFHRESSISISSTSGAGGNGARQQWFGRQRAPSQSSTLALRALYPTTRAALQHGYLPSGVAARDRRRSSLLSGVDVARVPSSPLFETGDSGGCGAPGSRDPTPSRFAPLAFHSTTAERSSGSTCPGSSSLPFGNDSIPAQYNIPSRRSASAVFHTPLSTNLFPSTAAGAAANVNAVATSSTQAGQSNVNATSSSSLFKPVTSIPSAAAAATGNFSNDTFFTPQSAVPDDVMTLIRVEERRKAARAATRREGDNSELSALSALTQKKN